MKTASTDPISYKSIEIPPSDPWNNPEEDTSSPRSTNRRTILLGSAVIGMLIVLVGVKARSAPPAPVMMGTAAVRDCSFEECYAARCDPGSAPFTCLFHNGGPHGGCSPIPWIKGTCTVQCNLKACDEIDVPPDTPDCEGVQCSPQWCKGRQACAPAVPFQCTSGAARFGCSIDPLSWTLYTDSVTCNDCCDVTTC